ncbi:hypothetical protein FRC10_002079 [Ceratobasidium sp. 414]|nr:hypothetical protein FRC10_002079 [Ceratobasidium sp. 414]
MFYPDQASLLRSLLTAEPKLLDAKDADDRTPLHWAASSGAIEIVHDLISRKAAIDPKDNSGWTPLMIAASAGHENVVQELLGAGANASAANDKGLTPLHRAASAGHDAFLTILLNPPEGRPKTRLNTGDRLGNTPLHLALDSAHAAAAVALIEAGADRSRLNADGQAPEEIEGVGGQEQKRAREYIVQRCGPA